MIFVIEDGGIPIPESDEDFQQFIKSERFIHYVGMINPPRPGVADFISIVEYRHFKPGTPRNELFIMRLIDWSNILWVIMSIPIEDRTIVEAVADECGLRIANGIPMSIDCHGTKVFPARNDQVFTLENKPDHPVYRNDSLLNKAMIEAECIDEKDIPTRKS